MRLAKLSRTLIAWLTLLAWGPSEMWAQSQAPAKAPPKAGAAAKRRAAKAPARAAAKAPRKAPAQVRPVVARQPIARRDPFDPLVGRGRPGGQLPERLPPGKAGLVISTLRVDGLVRAPNGMIAIVSNPQNRVYFLREGDQLYDGRVEQITMDAVAFHEVGKDAFGKPVERQVIKRLYPSPGEPR